ncbi:SDR family NAD(P)-dependent oxidoreductase, partial [Rhizobium sp.]
MTELNGKIAAVTGAASGIGLASTEAMLAAGATVVLVDRDEKALETVCARLGERAIPLKINLLDPDQCAGLLEGVLSKTGKLDI